ncbi:hypothetical protein JIN84_18030 [Luteolibacter yonseiensis]|uniref:Uncharacterized protein n=1 Tax=Luteolibacter yonseiensis TaxID=1144680 RepID=A0A934R971_9BACT|nr:hypothetical protein [Luteolibacter yonseiensis]MBK1817525.1 hypothetical protein [Luteolibacter yonseiensis]
MIDQSTEPRKRGRPATGKKRLKLSAVVLPALLKAAAAEAFASNESLSQWVTRSIQTRLSTADDSIPTKASRARKAQREKLSVTVPIPLIEAAKRASSSRGESLNHWVEEAIEAQLLKSATTPNQNPSVSPP